MTNKIHVIFDSSDLRIQENLQARKIKVFFGVEDIIPPLDCYTFVPDTTDFNCLCAKPWDEESNDFIIKCKDEPSTDLKFTAYQGEHVSTYIVGLEIYSAYQGESAEVGLEIYRTLFSPTVTMGEISTFEIENNRFFTPIVNVGETAELNVKFSPIAYFTPTANVGEEVKIAINIDYTFNVESYIGESVDVNIKTAPAIDIFADNYVGETAELNLNISSGFAPISYQGESVQFDITLPITDFIKATVITGEYTDISLYTEQSIYSYSYEGPMSFVDISTVYSINSDSVIGEEVNITFYEPINHIIDVDVYQGEEAKTTILSDSQFTPISYQGEYVDITLTLEPYEGYKPLVYQGEEVTFNIALVAELTFASEIGEEVKVDLETRPFVQINPTSYQGESVNVTPMFTVILGKVESTIGEAVNIELTELDNWEVHQGETVLAELATDVMLSSETNSGESVEIVLMTIPPVLLQPRAYQGEVAEADIKLLVSTTFEVRTYGGERVINQQWARLPYHIDLDRRRCCDDILTGPRHIELSDAPYNWTSYDYPGGICETVTFELSTRRALEFTAYQGESFEYDPTVGALSVTVSEGSTAYIRDIRIPLNIDLEPGNLIPEGDEVVIDIDRPIIKSEDIVVKFSSGEMSNFKLGATYGLQYKAAVGESAEFDLKIDPAIRLEVRVGEEARFNLSVTYALRLESHHGESLRSTFYEKPYTALIGEDVQIVLETKSDYYTELENEGCLDNEYQEIDPESGQPLPSLHKGASVEGEPFLAYIKGKCF